MNIKRKAFHKNRIYEFYTLKMNVKLVKIRIMITLLFLNIIQFNLF